MATSLESKALDTMHAWTESTSLRRHMMAVRTAVVAYARAEGADEDLWAATAILHDFDYEKHPDVGPDGHPFRGVAFLREEGWSDEVCEAILGHADLTGVERRSRLAKVLYACDEITGLITAATYVRPDRDVRELTLKSVKKKFKDKAFARGVAREDVVRGAEDLGVDLWDHVAFVLSAMQEDAEALGLDGHAEQGTD